ncbi:mitochondrial import inner membrane translocase subunit tim17, putative [Leishmania panamensis]|uniref:Mitochondrial import inner membrane translocase subunit TIM22 n=1 Tax=Leishmania panamensis TaxID=5679 RepID=A0A088RJE9_LEIPA|nr:mitochondrial import inner membrane translocase subunit tim17, putative [Leishmania panamensis]AIN96028.1 mitochondrial import inner membrane translocase subunit tim17, putative [Leishmania panamensis]
MHCRRARSPSSLAPLFSLMFFLRLLGLSIHPPHRHHHSVITDLTAHRRCTMPTCIGVRCTRTASIVTCVGRKAHTNPPRTEMTSILDPRQPIEPLQRAMMVAKDSTLATAMLNVFGGYIMGFGFSLFGSMISAETSTQAMGTADFFRHSLRSAHRLAGSFAFFGFLFGGIEVALEKRRGRKDQWNPTIAGAIIGGGYGWRSYKYPGLAAGIVGGAAFSLVFEKMLDAMGMAQH